MPSNIEQACGWSRRCDLRDAGADSAGAGEQYQSQDTCILLFNHARPIVNSVIRANRLNRINVS